MAFPKAILAVVHRERPGAEAAVAALRRWARARDVPLEVVPLGDPLPRGIDEGWLAVSLGGDGTLLHCAARVAPYGLPVLGVNLGSLGFLTQTDASRLPQALDRIGEGRFRLEERLRLRVRPEAAAEAWSALNETVLSRRDVHDFTEVVLRWGDEEIGRYPGDGVIVATPSGSTAYSLAAHGPILYPEVEGILLTPLNVHTLTLRPLVLPASVVLKAEWTGPGSLLVDGRKVATLEPGARVRIDRSPHPTRWVSLAEEHGSFFSLLRGKLGWGRGPQRASTDPESRRP